MIFRLTKLLNDSSPEAPSIEVEADELYNVISDELYDTDEKVDRNLPVGSTLLVERLS